MADFIPVTAEEWETTGELWRMLHTVLRSAPFPARKQLLFCTSLRRLDADRVSAEYRPILDELEVFADRPDLPAVELGKQFWDHSYRWSQRTTHNAIAKRHTEIAEACSAVMQRHLATKGVSGREYYEGYPGFEQDDSMFYTVAGHVFGARGDGPEGTQTDALRDVLGNPFRPVAFSPSWRTDTVILLARQMYDTRDFSAMPILADAIQDAGCDNKEVLNHCRTSALHFRGCWVCDLVLNKP